MEDFAVSLQKSKGRQPGTSRRNRKGARLQGASWGSNSCGDSLQLDLLDSCTQDGALEER